MTNDEIKILETFVNITKDNKTLLTDKRNLVLYILCKETLARKERGDVKVDGDEDIGVTVDKTGNIYTTKKERAGERFCRIMSSQPIVLNKLNKTIKDNEVNHEHPYEDSKPKPGPKLVNVNEVREILKKECINIPDASLNRDILQAFSNMQYLLSKLDKHEKSKPNEVALFDPELLNKAERKFYEKHGFGSIYGIDSFVKYLSNLNKDDL